jgi:hypothetical protein
MRFEVSDSHHNRLAGVSTLHLLVPRDDLEYAIHQIYLIKTSESRDFKKMNEIRVFTLIYRKNVLSQKST